MGPRCGSSWALDVVDLDPIAAVRTVEQEKLRVLRGRAPRVDVRLVHLLAAARALVAQLEPLVAGDVLPAHLAAVRWRGRIPAGLGSARRSLVGRGRIRGDDRGLCGLRILGRREERIGHRGVSGPGADIAITDHDLDLREGAGDVADGSVEDLQVATGHLLERQRQRLDKVRRVGVGGEGHLERLDRVLVEQVARHRTADVGQSRVAAGSAQRSNQGLQHRPRDCTVRVRQDGLKRRLGILASPVTTRARHRRGQSECARVTLS
jgi:hypothetical protein